MVKHIIRRLGTIGTFWTVMLLTAAPFYHFIPHVAIALAWYLLFTVSIAFFILAGLLVTHLLQEWADD